MSLQDDFPQDEALRVWAKDVKAIYEQAVAWAGQELDPGLSPRQLDRVRVAQQHAFEQHLWKLCQPYAHMTAPQHTLCERVEQFLPELFVFVLTVNRNGAVWLCIRADFGLLKSGQMLMVSLVCAITVHGHHIQNDAVVGHAVDGSHYMG